MSKESHSGGGRGQRVNFKGDKEGEIPEEIKGEKPTESEDPPSSLFDWFFESIPILLMGIGLGLFLYYMFTSASVVEMIEDVAAE